MYKLNIKYISILQIVIVHQGIVELCMVKIMVPFGYAPGRYVLGTLRCPVEVVHGDWRLRVQFVQFFSSTQAIYQVVKLDLMSLKGCIEFEPQRMQKFLLGDSPIKARCVTWVGFRCSRSKALLNWVDNQQKKNQTCVDFQYTSYLYILK